MRQTGDSGGVSGTGAVVYRVGVQARPCEALQQVVLLVGAAGRAHDADGEAALAADLEQAAGDQVEGLVPGRVLPHAVPLDHRRGDALGAVDEIGVEAALDAQRPLVRRRVVGGGDPDDLAVGHVEVEAAAHAAEGAGGADLLAVPGVRPVELPVGEGPGGAHVDALAAEAAERDVQLLVERGGHLRVEAALGEVDRLGDLHVAADADALAAEDAAFGVVGDQRLFVEPLVVAGLCPLEGVGEDLVLDAVTLQFAVAVRLADALQAQLGAAYRLVLLEAELDLVEVGLALPGLEFGHVGRRALLVDAGVDVDERRRDLGEPPDVALHVALGLERLQERRVT